VLPVGNAVEFQHRHASVLAFSADLLVQPPILKQCSCSTVHYVVTEEQAAKESQTSFFLVGNATLTIEAV